jgi:hypothetical protein
MNVTHLGAGGLLGLAGRLVSAFDQAGVGEEILNPREARDVIDLIQQRQREDVTNARDGSQQIEFGLVVLPDLVQQEQLEIPERLVVGTQEGDIGGDGHLDSLVVKVLDDRPAVFGLVDPLLEDRQIVSSVGVLDVGQQLAAFPGEEEPTPQQVSGWAQLPRIDVGVGEIATAQQRGDLEGIDSIVFGLAAVDSLHLQCMAEDEGEALLGAEVGAPVPAEEAFDSDDQVFAVGPESAQELLTIAGELLVDEDIAGLIEDAQIEAAGVEVDAAVVNMLFPVESHRGLLSWFRSTNSLPRW